MTAQHSKSVLFNLLAALALLAGLVGGVARPASADASQWQIQQPHWWDNSNGWRNHHQWPSQWHRHNQFNNGFHQCFGSCFGSRIVIRSNRVFFISPGVVGNPGFIVRQPTAFIVRQPAFIIGGPGFTVQTARQRAFFKRHPSLQSGQPMRMHHSGIHFITPGMHHSGVHWITPGM